MAKYKVTLSASEKEELTLITSQGKHAVRKIKRAQILLLSDSKNETIEAMAEIEIGNMNQQCLDRRIASKERLIDELASWEKARNSTKASIHWMFNVETAREKLDKAYAKLTCQN